MTRWLALMLLVSVLVACTSDTGTSVGVVTEVEGTLTDVESFTVLTEGEEVRFLPLEGQSYEFPLDHLREHLRSGEPVTVEWEIRDGNRYALTITDG
jgi:archaellum component FlaF (FlaF/FlaG flagellin family)